MLLDSFEAIAATDPDRVAIRCHDEKVSYCDLNQSANLLAHWLLQTGIKPGDSVCVFFEPSPQSLVSLLAILKIGGVYVPLDVEHPAKRIAFLLEDTKPAIILTRSYHCDRLPQDANTHIIDHYSQPAPTKNKNTPNAAPTVTLNSHQPAYIFYTSGTTGNPKGVVASRSNLAHYCRSAILQFSMNHQTVMPTIARLTFSISLLEWLCPLLAGGCVYVLSRDTVMDIPKMAGLLKQFTMMHMGPSLLTVLVRYLQQKQVPVSEFEHIHHISSGGDLIKPELLNALCTYFPNAQKCVVYGCTELACMATFQEINEHTLPHRPIIGKPFPNVDIVFLDEQQNPVDYPEWGEMYVSGPGVTLGYLHQSALTDQKFIKIGQTRCYRTGDIARQQPNGTIEFLGRRDFQIQVHGIRLELGEIESQLCQINGIKEAIVIGRPSDTESDDINLVAYLVLGENNPPAFSEIKRRLTDYLPKYMVPNQFVVVDSFPLNANLKVDRAALPIPSPSNLLQQSVSTVAPTNPTEKTLLSIWQNLFKGQALGIHHDFFDLGGDSLLAIDLIMAIDKQFQRRLTLSQLLHHSSIAKLAQHLTQLETHSTLPNDLVILQQGKPGPAIFLIHGAIVYKDVCASLPRDQTVCVLYRNDEADSLGNQDISGLMASYSSISDIARHYLDAIKTFQPEGPYYLVGFSIGGLIAMEMLELLAQNNEQVGDIILIDTHVPAFAHQAKWRKVLYHIQQMFMQGIPHIKYLTWKVLMQFQRQNNANEQDAERIRKNTEELRRQARNNASADYQPKPSSHSTILFKATERPRYEIKDRLLGWGNYLSRLEVHDLPGDHNQLLSGKNASKIALTITQHFLTNQKT